MFRVFLIISYNFINIEYYKETYLKIINLVYFNNEKHH